MSDTKKISTLRYQSPLSCMIDTGFVHQWKTTTASARRACACPGSGQGLLNKTNDSNDVDTAMNVSITSLRMVD